MQRDLAAPTRRAGHVASRGGKSGLSNKPIFAQPFCLSKQHKHGEEPEAHASGAYLLLSVQCMQASAGDRDVWPASVPIGIAKQKGEKTRRNGQLKNIDKSANRLQQTITLLRTPYVAIEATSTNRKANTGQSHYTAFTIYLATYRNVNLKTKTCRRHNDSYEFPSATRWCNTISKR